MKKIRLKTTYSCIVELNQKNCQTKHCRTSQQSPNIQAQIKRGFQRIRFKILLSSSLPFSEIRMQNLALKTI